MEETEFDNWKKKKVSGKSWKSSSLISSYICQVCSFEVHGKIVDINVENDLFNACVLLPFSATLQVCNS